MIEGKTAWMALLAAVCLAWVCTGGEAAPALGQAAVEEKLVALTFDDGPQRETTSRLLDGLRERGIPATFFLIGSQMEGNEDLIARMAAEGHSVGLHTWDHLALTGLGDRDFTAQVDRQAQALTALTGKTPLLLRPPYGFVDRGVQDKSPYPLILWSVDPEDWKLRDRAKVTQALLSQTRDGDVLLLHDIYPSSVEAALETADALRDRGFTFVTVEELARRRGTDLEPGQVYRGARWNEY